MCVLGIQVILKSGFPERLIDWVRFVLCVCVHLLACITISVRASVVLEQNELPLHNLHLFLDLSTSSSLIKSLLIVKYKITDLNIILIEVDLRCIFCIYIQHQRNGINEYKYVRRRHISMAPVWHLLYIRWFDFSALIHHIVALILNNVFTNCISIWRYSHQSLDQAGEVCGFVIKLIFEWNFTSNLNPSTEIVLNNVVFFPFFLSSHWMLSKNYRKPFTHSPEPLKLATHMTLIIFLYFPYFIFPPYFLALSLFLPYFRLRGICRYLQFTLT